jgi:S-methylmethionine-dependent homocysteine/selenocysteine methylase
MSKKMSFLDRLSSGQPVVLDGAVNTELSRRGLLFNTHEWLKVNLESPSTLAQIHADYARAGAELHIANSFSTARHVLEAAGLATHYDALNRAAVELCREAVDGAAAHQQWIAGSLSTYAADHDRNNLPSLEILEKNAGEHAMLLAKSGCDLLAVEMLFDVDVSIAVLKGAARAGLPVSMGLVCTVDASGQAMLFGTGRASARGTDDVPLKQSLSRILDALSDTVPLIVTVMHSESEHTGPALAAIGQCWDGEIGAYPNNGHYAAPGGWDISKGYTPSHFAKSCQGWVNQGVSVVGGCCGVGPEHIRALSTHLRIHGA